MFGYTRAEIEQLKFQSITHLDDLNVNLQYRDSCLIGDISNYHLEKRYIHKDGQTIWGHISVSLIRDAQDRPLYFVTHIQDITTRKLAELTLVERPSILYDI
jgi:PAS domain S-box-containing protein